MCKFFYISDLHELYSFNYLIYSIFNFWRFITFSVNPFNSPYDLRLSFVNVMNVNRFLNKGLMYTHTSTRIDTDIKV